MYVSLPMLYGPYNGYVTIFLATLHIVRYFIIMNNIDLMFIMVIEIRNGYVVTSI